MMTFDPAGPLPTGTVVLEASAGTGKTHAIAALATRYIAEGTVTVEHLAVISFSRVASEELRSRVRERFRRSAAVIEAAVNAAPLSGLDATDTALVAAEPAVLQERLERLRAAMAGVDSAGIMTIHQFCQTMFTELGVLASEDPEATLVEDLSPLLEEVVADLYLARYAALSDRPFDLATAHQLARAAAIQLPTAALTPHDAGPVAQERLAFATAVREEMDRRKRALGIFSYDDQLLRLSASLQGATGQAGAERLRRRCRVVLVDEFQDTDPVQWGILRDTFAGRVPLVLIGDPKQAIYAFRGADVNAYADAVQACDERYSLDINFRADEPVVAAITGLFGTTSLGPSVSVQPVRAHHLGSRLSGAAPAPVAVRYLSVETALSAAQARDRIQQDLVHHVVQLLSDEVYLAAEQDRRRLAEHDIAVLVTTNRRGRDLAAALAAAGVAVAFSGSDSVFAAPAAADWLSLLRALDQPRRPTIREALLTDFVGADLTDLATADDQQLADWAALLQGWGRILNEQGIAALFAAVQIGTEDRPGLAERLLHQQRGERDLTDFRQLAEILHAQHRSGVRGPALVTWLAEEISGSETAGDRTRRLETDRRAVQVMTVHKAKGLQFPVVLLPQMTDLWLSDEDKGHSFDFHDEDRQRVLDLGGKDAPGRAERRARHAAEQAEDRLRALYVAATRAQCQLTMWWAPTRRNTESSPLHRLLYRDRTRPGRPEPSYPFESAAGLTTPAALSWLAGAGIAVQACGEASTASLPQHRQQASLTVPSWQRRIDHLWRRTSYSGLTAAAHEFAATPATNAAIITDEPDESSTTTEVSGPASPMADLPGGTSFGSLVHQVLENLDWHAPTDAELDQRLQQACGDALARYSIADLSAATLADALKPSLLTPLGRLTQGRALAEVQISDRLSELDFEFALGRADSTTTLSDVAALLRRTLSPDDPLIDYPDDLDNPLLSTQVLRGFLTGSIDSVLRLPGQHGPRFVVIDYKTNRLGPADLRLAHYSRAAMTAEMRHTHYPLQALLYCVALHRFLQARLEGYRPEHQLGGVGYLFVRGMGGVEAGADTGVFDWYPPTATIVALSELLADGRQP